MTSRRYKRTDLFLVRVWTDYTGEGESEGDGRDGDKVEWRGRVQRVVDGEAHRFSDWQGLVDTLLVMLADAKRR
jgi:hypothetical protein